MDRTRTDGIIRTGFYYSAFSRRRQPEILQILSRGLVSIVRGPGIDGTPDASQAGFAQAHRHTAKKFENAGGKACIFSKIGRKMVDISTAGMVY